eukprot:CAMPEP_0181309114 /NCGR_PEP_ID=MMETSP1101-20121128/11841_1 /TAXON_ID=46948 /ORGANISM="Rhodomonas abbreviata, Strain Caron Lab Isolate" /LENGTH=261 /DNA_ID=CAMNT_0023415577 /DNA_START=552 /DNA_END=1336 /DNA_ORIENTATION=-
MTRGEDFTDAFAPVPCSTAGRLLMSMAAALNLEMHCVDFSQAGMQSSRDDLPEDVQQVFIHPPSGWDEEPGVVYEVPRPLYGIPSSAHALHFTIQRILVTHGMLDANPVKTPLEPGARLTKKEALKVTQHDCITWSRPDNATEINILMGWVDSDYASNLLCNLGSAQTKPTKVWEDNASCVAMSENPANASLCRCSPSQSTALTFGAPSNSSKRSTPVSWDFLPSKHQVVRVGAHKAFKTGARTLGDVLNEVRRGWQCMAS